jgi:hypothetical protein
MKIIDRNKKIIQEYLLGKTYQQVGILFGISKQRIEQIITQNKVEKRGYPKKVEKETRFCLKCKKSFTAYPKSKTKHCSHSCSTTLTEPQKEKVCCSCKVLKSGDSFYPKYGIKTFATMSRCKRCHLILTKKWMAKNKEKVKIYNKRASQKYYQKNRNKINENTKEKRRLKKQHDLSKV